MTLDTKTANEAPVDYSVAARHRREVEARAEAIKALPVPFHQPVVQPAPALERDPESPEIVELVARLAEVRRLGREGGPSYRLGQMADKLESAIDDARELVAARSRAEVANQGRIDAANVATLPMELHAVDDVLWLRQCGVASIVAAPMTYRVPIISFVRPRAEAEALWTARDREELLRAPTGGLVVALEGESRFDFAIVRKSLPVALGLEELLDACSENRVLVRWHDSIDSVETKKAILERIRRVSWKNSRAPTFAEAIQFWRSVGRDA